MFRISTYPTCVSLFFASSLLLSTGAQAQTVPSAIRPQAVERLPGSSSMDSHVMRRRAVELDLSQLDEQAAKGFERSRKQAASFSKRVHFPLFSDVDLTVQLKEMQRSADGRTVTWAGAVEGMKWGQAAIALTDGILSANFSTDSGAKYEIRYAENATHWVQEMDAEPQFPELNPVPVTNELPRSRRFGREAVTPSAVTTAKDDGSTIDVMVVYTPAARTAAGGVTQMQNLVQLGITETNQGYANSGVAQRVRLVYSGEVAYVESGDFGTDLTRLRTVGDSYMDTVPAIRDQYGADIVSLWVETGNACGIGYQMSSMTWDFSPYAYNVVMRSCATGYYSFGHEMGHNMGAQHDRVDAGSPGIYSYSYGYQQTAVQPFFRTIMSYACAGGVNCPRLNFWSDPDVQYSGLPVGVVSTSSTAADNHLTLNNTHVYVANYRQSVSTPTPAPQPTVSINPGSASVAYGASTGSVTVTATSGFAWTATSNASWVAITSGATGSGNGTVIYSIAANSATSSRSAALTIGTQTFAISQAAAPAPPPPADNRAHIISPAPGTVLTSRNVVFTWSAGPAGSQYYFALGTQPNTADLYMAPQYSRTSMQFSSLPNTGKPLYVWLWTLINGAWQAPLTYTYTTCTNCDALPSK